MYSIIDRSLSQTQQLHGDAVRAPLGDGLLDEFLGERLRILIRGRREQIVRDLLVRPATAAAALGVLEQTIRREQDPRTAGVICSM